MELERAVKACDPERVRQLLDSGCERNGLAVEAAVELQNTHMLEMLVGAMECDSQFTARVCMRADIFLFTFMWKKGYPVNWYRCYTAAQVNGHTKMCIFLKLVCPEADYPLYKCIRCNAIYEESNFKAYLAHRTWCKKRKNVGQDVEGEKTLRKGLAWTASETSCSPSRRHLEVEVDAGAEAEMDTS